MHSDPNLFLFVTSTMADWFAPLILILGGFVVGTLVGLTGVGGGSLMTPFLILAIGVKPQLAVGTDLLFAALTKLTGVPSLIKSKRIDWRIVGALLVGSLPASVITSLWLRSWVSDELASVWIPRFLGFSLLLTAAAILLNKQLSVRHPSSLPVAQTMSLERFLLCVFTGLLLGLLVTLTSVGAGALGTACLMLLFPVMPLNKLVGNDLAHAVPLTAVAAAGHVWLGTVDWSLLFWLLIGSIPGIQLGLWAHSRVPVALTKIVLASLLTTAAVKLI
jgi:uncharacterized protein